MSDFPLPDTQLDATRPFWEGAAREELVIPRCSACGRFVWYPRDRCPGCGGEEMPWQPVSGRGTLFSWAVVRRAWVKEYAPLAPYATALVALDEDPSVRVVSLVVDCEPATLRIGMPLRAVFRPLAYTQHDRQVVAPHFIPAEANP